MGAVAPLNVGGQDRASYQKNRLTGQIIRWCQRGDPWNFALGPSPQAIGDLPILEKIYLDYWKG